MRLVGHQTDLRLEPLAPIIEDGNERNRRGKHPCRPLNDEIERRIFGVVDGINIPAGR